MSSAPTGYGDAAVPPRPDRLTALVMPPTDHSPRALEETEYDVVVLGGGSTGQNVADYAVRGGLSAVVVEAELVGGECSYWACMPSKALLRPGQALAAARSVDGAAQAVAGQLDVQAVLARRDGFAGDWDDGGQVRWLEAIGVPLARGYGRLTGARQVEVAGEPGVVLRARHAVAICTGSSPKLPPVGGLDAVGAWGSREATSAQAAPGRLLVLGGGVVGVEMAGAWSALGTQVTLLQRGERLLAGFEPEAGELVARALRDRGVDVRLGFDAQRARRRRDGTVVLSTSSGEVEGDELLVATGRVPRTHDVGLETVGLAPGSALRTDDTLRVHGIVGGWL